MTWRVGMKAECVDARRNAGKVWGGGPALEQGRVYTVARVVTNRTGTVALELAECPRGSLAVAVGMSGFAASRFRPVVEREYDISIFTAMLNPAKKAAETVALLGFGTVICWGFMLADFLGGQ